MLKIYINVNKNVHYLLLDEKKEEEEAEYIHHIDAMNRGGGHITYLLSKRTFRSLQLLRSSFCYCCYCYYCYY